MIDKKTFLHEHIKYEIEMLVFSYKKLAEYSKLQDQMKINSFLEVFLVHSRNLYEFLYIQNKKYNTDSRASDFFNKDSDWRDILPVSLTKKDIDNRTGKELAHITYKRIDGTPKEKARAVSKIFQDLQKIIKLFLIKIPKELDGKLLLKEF